MKKITLTLLGLFAMSTSALAQQEVKFGPKAGVNFATLSGKDAGDAKMAIGFHVGAFVEVKLNDKFAIQPEILYSAQGAKGKSDAEQMGISVSSQADLKTSYLNVPIMAKYYVTPNFAFEAGPYVGFLMNAKTEFTSEIMGISTEGTYDVKEAMNTVDFGVGVGANFNLENGFFVGARYNLGLSKIYKDYKADTSNPNLVIAGDSQANIKNSVIQVSVGYKF